MGLPSSTPGFEELCLRQSEHAIDGDPLVSSIAQSTTFVRDGVGSTATHQYSRVSNPTVATLERLLGCFEHAGPGVCFSSGVAAESALFLTLLTHGDHVVCGRSVYGGTTRLLQQLFPKLGVQVSFVDATDLVALRQAIRVKPKLVFVETPSNPTLELTDIRSVATMAREGGALLAVDNTFQTPVLQQPLDCGADLSVYSTTKFIEGHSAALGGAIVSRDEELLKRIRFIRKCTGAIQTPFHAWLTLQGIKTLPLRIRHQSATAQAVAQWLARQTCVTSVYYPSLRTGSDGRLADAQHLGAHGAVVSFELAGGASRCRAFVERLKLCRLAEHVGSVETLITHPATMTHADVPPDERIQVGITDGLLRLSLGLEPADAIIADFQQALVEIPDAVRLTRSINSGNSGSSTHVTEERLCPDVL